MGAGNQVFWDRRPCPDRIAVATQRVRRFSCERSISARMLSAYRGESATTGGWMAQGRPPGVSMPGLVGLARC